MTFHTFPNLRLLHVALFLLSLSLLAGLGVFAYLGIFSRYSADDYCFSSRLAETDNLLDATLDWYLDTSNRYTTMPLVGISEWFGPSAIQFLPGLAIGLWVASLAWTLSNFSEKSRFSYPRLTGFVLAGLIAYYSILEAPNRHQSLYWRSGMVTYFAPLVAFGFLAGLILTETWRGNLRSKSAWSAVLIVIWLGFFLAGGLSETTLAIQSGALGLAILMVSFLPRSEQKRKALTLLLTGLSASFLALVVIFLSPANALRVRAFGPPPSVADMLQFSLIFAWDFMRDTFESLPTPMFVSLFTAVLLGFSLSSGESPLSKLKPLIFSLNAIPFITYLLIFASMTPSVYGQGSYPGARALMATRAVMVTGWVAFGFLSGAFLRRTIDRVPVNSRVRSLMIGAGVLLLYLGSAYPLYSTGQTLELLPEHRARAERWDAREAEIRQMIASGERDLVVRLLPGWQEVKEIDGDPGHWVNLCAAEYYGVNSIRSVPMGEP
jgi:hypothetical protein